MNWKSVHLNVFLIVICLTSKLSYAKLSKVDIEETSELVVNHLAPLLENNGFTAEDLPEHLKYLTAKYYLLFSRGDEPLDNLEKLISDYNIVRESQHKIAEHFQEHVEHFVKINESNNKKAMKKLLTKDVVESFNFELQIVKPKDAITFLLYQEAYPEIMRLLSIMIQNHYETYVEYRVKEKKQSSSDTDPPSKVSQQQSSSDTASPKPTVDSGFAAMTRELVASHGRMGLLKRLVAYLEGHIPAVDPKNVKESTLDYLDDLQQFLEAESQSLWHFIKGPIYIKMTDYWIARVEKLYSDFSAIVPIQEILNIFDAAVLNSNDRRAFLVLRSELVASRNGEVSDKVANTKDVLKLIIETVINDIATIRGILIATATDPNSEKVSEDIFLKYMDGILKPHDITTKDLSTEMLFIISRTFTRIASIKGDSSSDEHTKILTTNIKLFRESLQKARDTIAIAVPAHSDSSRTELQALLKLIVNKFGSFILEQEGKLVQFVNDVVGNLDERKKFEDDVSNFAQQLELSFKNLPIKPSVFLKERFFELIEGVDVFVSFTSS